jgi:hypothetical protein
MVEKNKSKDFEVILEQRKSLLKQKEQAFIEELGIECEE